MILNPKVSVVKMRPLMSRLQRGGGGGEAGGRAGCHGDPPPPLDLKSDCIKEIACPISIVCE